MSESLAFVFSWKILGSRCTAAGRGKKIEGSKRLGGRKRKVKTNREKKWGEERQERHTNPYLPSSTETEENPLGKAMTLPII